MRRRTLQAPGFLEPVGKSLLTYFVAKIHCSDGLVVYPGYNMPVRMDIFTFCETEENLTNKL